MTDKNEKVYLGPPFVDSPVDPNCWSMGDLSKSDVVYLNEDGELRVRDSLYIRRLK